MQKIVMSSELITICENASLKNVDVDDDLGSHMPAGLRQTLDELVSQITPKILINLSKVHHIYSMAIDALVGTLRGLKRQDGDLKIFGLATNIERPFDLVGGACLVRIYDSERDARNDF
jgi:anti-anti-sigma factor